MHRRAYPSLMTTHPAFARAYEALATLGERSGFGGWRSQALAPATGRLLILGLGPGHDLAHLPPTVTSVVAIEPDLAMRSRAQARIAATPVPVHLVGGAGECLPLADASCDTVLCGLVLCTVDDPAAVLAEVRRVLRPGGSLLLFEHVRGFGRRQAWLHDRLDASWGRVAGGCHLNRRTREVLVSAGFDDSEVRDVTVRAGLPWMTAHLLGVARLASSTTDA